MTDLGQVRHDNFPHLAEVVTLIRFQDVSQTCQCCPFVGRLVLTTFPHSRLQYLSKTVNLYDFPLQPSPVSVAHTVNPYDSLTAVASICHTHSVNPYDFPSQSSPVSVTHTQSTLMTFPHSRLQYLSHTVNPYDSLLAVTSICHTHSQPL